VEKALYREMYEMETRHWWFVARRRIVLELLRRYLVAEKARPRVLDLGCGTGSMLQALEELGEATGMDVSEEALAFASTRTRARLLKGNIPEDLAGLQEEFDAVLMLDLLEHLDADKKAVTAAADLLAEGGVLLLTVPAYRWLYSPRDRFHHHRRRYSRREVRDMVRGAGLSEVFTSYYNCLLFPPAAAQRLWSRLSRVEPGPDLREPPAMLNSLLEIVFSTERFLLGRVPFPWGLSVVSVARKGCRHLDSHAWKG
jgi:SAM-dependent methyltransferase